MYHSGFFASDIIETVKSETNDSFPVSLVSYVNRINGVEQLLYSDIVKEQRLSEMPFKKVISFGELPLDEACEDIPRFADIIHIYGINADGSSVELEFSSAENVLRGVQADNSYYFDGHDIKVCADGYESLIIMWIARPAPKRVIGETVIGSIMLPPEFIELLICKLRAEKYRLTNDDALCAKWADEYNYHLLNFKNFVDARRPKV
jgi:hypothetical protein